MGPLAGGSFLGSFLFWREESSSGDVCLLVLTLFAVAVKNDGKDEV